MANIRAFLTWPYKEKKLAFIALFSVGIIRLALSILPFKFLNEKLILWSRRNKARSANSPLPGDVAANVRRASRYIPRATCLTQALATRTLLEFFGQSVQLKIGIGRDEREMFQAHAWIDVDGKVIIGDLSDLHRYSVLYPSEKKTV